MNGHPHLLKNLDYKLDIWKLQMQFFLFVFFFVFSVLTFNFFVFKNLKMLRGILRNLTRVNTTKNTNGSPATHKLVRAGLTLKQPEAKMNNKINVSETYCACKFDHIWLKWKKLGN